MHFFLKFELWECEIENLRMINNSSSAVRDLSNTNRSDDFSRMSEDNKGNAKDSNKLKMQLAELSDRAEIYKQQLLTLKENALR
jgi:hypothetical protein